MDTVRCVSPVVGTSSLVGTISLGSRWTRLELLVRGVVALCVRSAQLSHLQQMRRYFFDVTVACGGPVNVLDFTLCAFWLSALTLSLRQRAREHSTALHALTCRISPHTCVKVCNIIVSGSYGSPWPTEKSAKCEALQRVHDCRSHGGRSARSAVQRPAEATPLHRRSSSSHAPTRKHKRLRAVILNLERLEPYCGALILGASGFSWRASSSSLPEAGRSATCSRGEAAFCQACTACGGADVTAFSFRLRNVCDRAHNGANRCSASSSPTPSLLLVQTPFCLTDQHAIRATIRCHEPKISIFVQLLVGRVRAWSWMHTCGSQKCFFGHPRCMTEECITEKPWCERPLQK